MNQNIEFCTFYYNDPVLSLHESQLLELPLVLAALDNAQTLRWREWIIGEPGEDVP